jgi:hypothetical protein
MVWWGVVWYGKVRCGTVRVQASYMYEACTVLCCFIDLPNLLIIYPFTDAAAVDRNELKRKAALR